MLTKLRRKTEMIILGLTGGIGCGKSEVCAYLKDKYNAYIIKTDDLGHDAMAPGGIAYGALTELLGTEYILPDGNFDRKALGSRAFREPELLKKMNAIIHPAVRKMVEIGLENARNSGYMLAVIESALLIEAGYRGICTEFWYIYASEDVRVKRLTESRGLTPEKIADIMDKQRAEEEFRKECDVTIDNSFDLEITKNNIDERLKELGVK